MTILSEIKLIIDIYKLLHIEKIVKYIKSIFVKPVNILIIGSGGTGKTTLGKFLNGEFKSVLNAHPEYLESMSIETFKFNDNINLEVIPGQKHRLSSNFATVAEKIEKGLYSGIIYVCSYGYHSLGDIDHRLTMYYEHGDSKADFLKKYLDSRKKVEIEIFNSIHESILMNKKPLWLLIFVGKQDLWHPDKDNVERYYRSFAFNDEICKLEKNKKNNDFRTETIFGCLKIGRFTTGKGKVLSNNCIEYEQNHKAKSLNRLIETINALLQWNVKK